MINIKKLQENLDLVAEDASLEELAILQEWIDILNFINN